ncbi:type II secretion system F family protein [bacterium]|nr:type II secretion system F family protein [bacterium]
MAEYRYHGMNSAGRPIQGLLTAKNKKSAMLKLTELMRVRRFNLNSLEKKRTYVYKVSKGNERAVRGERKAYSQEELSRALRAIGYKVLSVRRKPLDFRMSPPSSDVVMFIRLGADLLREKLPYDEVLELLGNDIQNRTLREAIKEISSDLKEGREGKEVFGKQEDALGRFPAHMLGVAAQSGNMVEIYESTAKFLERNQAFKKSLRSALIMPCVTVFLLLCAVLFYVGYIFPETAEMFLKFDMKLPPMTRFTLDVSYFLRDNIILLLIGTFVPIAVALKLAFTNKGRFLIDKYIIRLPIIGSLLHKTSIEIFCRVFTALYSGSGENIEVIRTSAEACRNRYMERQIKEIAIPMMIKEGKGLVESLERTGVFTENALNRLRGGAETGTLRKTALQVANYYEKETTYKMKAIIDWVQVFIAFFVLIVMTGITVVSSETAIMKPTMPGVTVK